MSRQNGRCRPASPALPLPARQRHSYSLSKLSVNIFLHLSLEITLYAVYIHFVFYGKINHIRKDEYMKQKLLLVAAVFFGLLAFVLTYQQIENERNKVLGLTKDVSLIAFKRAMASGESSRSA